MEIKIQNLKKTYGSKTAVDIPDYTLQAPEILGLMGNNGAGKTTTLRMISTLLGITSGTISVFGHDVATESEEVRKIISYLPEDAGAYKDMTGRAYLEFMASFFASGERKDEMVERGWYYYDFLVVTADAYIDHPSFGTAIIARVLEAEGYRVAVLAQPDWHSADAFRAMGRPRYGVMIGGGNIDSMVAHYLSLIHI